MENHASWLKWLMHTMTLAPFAHLAIGLPVYFILFSGSVVYAVGLGLFAVASILPFEFVHSLAITYAVSGKLLVGFTLYQGWPVPLVSLIPALYLTVLLVLRYKLRETNFKQWVAYLVENLWRSILLSLVIMLIGIACWFIRPPLRFSLGTVYGGIPVLPCLPFLCAIMEPANPEYP